VHWLLALAVAWVASPPPGATTTALVEREGRLLAGTDLGLFAAGPAGWERTPISGAVVDAAALPGALWVATSRGLWVWEDGAEPRFVALGAGARMRSLALDPGGAVWVATESGLFVRAAGASTFERETSLPPGDMLAVRAADGALFAARPGALWARRGARFELLASGLDGGWWELRAAGAWRGAVYLAVPRGLWRVGGGRVERIELGVGEVRDLYAAAPGLWVATSRGVWRFAQAPLPVGALPEPWLDGGVSRLRAEDGRLLAAADRGVAALTEAEAEPVPSASGASATIAPDVHAVHAAVLAYLDLAPEALRGVEQRARRKGWLPELRAGLSADHGRRRDHDRDEVLSSGEVWRLYDANAVRDRGVSADVQVIWDLDQVAAPDDAIAISRERRLVVELRDQVLERVNRLYFERLRAGDALAAADDAAKRRELELRVAELTAQLDAWTGGRFSRLLSDSPRIDRRQP
jgi:hypothetical protein